MPAFLYLPNNGITSRIMRPVDMNDRYPDPNQDLVVSLAVTRARARPGWTPGNKDNHWRLTWLVGYNRDGYPVQRNVHLVQDIGVNHLTNWGAMTKICSERSSVCIPLKTMSLSHRKTLESIAWDTPVRIPDGRWNCQDWIMTVLEGAIRQGLVTRSECDAALRAAVSLVAP